MGESLFRQLDRSEVEAAAADAVAWGFPRDIRPLEIDRADWFRMGDSVVFWFEHYGISSTYFVHIATAPAVRKRWGVRRWLRFIERWAADQGASELGFVSGPVCVAESEGFLRRLHWRDTDYGLCKPLGAA